MKADSTRDRSPFDVGPWHVVAGVWVAWGLVNVLRLSAMGENSLLDALWWGLPDAVIWAVLTPVVGALARHGRSLGSRRILYWPLAGFSVAFAHVLLDVGISSLRALAAGVPARPGFVLVKLLRYGLYTNLLVFVAIAVLVLGLDASRDLSRREREAAELRALLSEARLDSLRRQFRPHFLFNALNTVAASFGHEPEIGRRVVRRLGELLRASLRSDEQALIPLTEELDLARAYLEIEQVRFGDRLTTRVEAEPGVESWQVPALILQPLVENAVVHGVSHRAEGGLVRVLAREVSGALHVVVEDDGPGPAGVESGGFGVGLKNSRERLLFHFGADASLEAGPWGDGGTGFRVRLLLPAPTGKAA